MPAPERERVGRDGKRSERERRLRREEEKMESRKGEKGGEGEKAEEKDEREGVLGPGPFIGVSLASPSPTQGQGWPNPPAGCLPQGWLPGQGHVEVRGSPEATSALAEKEGTQNFHWRGSGVGYVSCGDAQPLLRFWSGRGLHPLPDQNPRFP